MWKTNRRFGILDAMILVASIAVGLAWARFQAEKPGHLFAHFDSNLPGFGEADAPRVVILLGRAWETYALAAPPMATVALGLLLCRFRRPGPRFSEPGASAFAAVAVVLALTAIRFVVDLLRYRINANYQMAKGLPIFSDWWDVAYDTLRPAEPGIAVIAAWSALAMTGQLRWGRSTIDRLGVLVAGYWVLTMVFSWFAGHI